MRRSELRAAGFTLIEITMVLILLGILAAVAVPKYFDMQEEARIKAADSAIAEAQARINAYFGQLLLEGNSCEQAVAGLNADLSRDIGHIADATDANGKVFGDVTLKIGGELLANGSATLVTAYFNGQPLAGGPHGSLVAAQCSGETDPVTALKMFASIGKTGSANQGGIGVIGSYIQSNSKANQAVIDQAQKSFDEFIGALGWEGDVGYWRLLQNDDETNVFWTDHDITNLQQQRVPFIKAHQTPDGTTTYSVGLVGVVSIDKKGAMLLRDAGNGGTFGMLYGYNEKTNGYFVSGSESGGYTLSASHQGRTEYSSYDDALKAYQALNTAFTNDAKLVDGTDNLNGISFGSGSAS